MGNLSPTTYVFSTFITAVTTVAAYYFFSLDENYFLLPVVMLAILYALANLNAQGKQESEFSVLAKFDWKRLLQQALARYAVWFVLISSGALFYQQIPYYSSDRFIANEQFFSLLLHYYVILGLPYFILTLIVKSSRREDFYDPAVRLIHMFRQLFFAMTGEHKKAFSAFRNRYNRKVMLNLVMRVYFIPVMIIQLLELVVSAMMQVQSTITGHSLLGVLYLVVTVLWLMDIINAGLAYSLESRWLENRSRSIDLDFTGWLVCLSCYAPVNMVTSSLFAWAPDVATNNHLDLLSGSMGLLVAIKIIETLILSAHVYADISLGPSVANITLKKLQTKGMYSIVRHPGTVCKLCFWLVQSVFYKGFWSVKYIFGYSMWAMIYVLRAITEERHLKKFYEYRDYMKRVRFRFIPFVF